MRKIDSDAGRHENSTPYLVPFQTDVIQTPPFDQTAANQLASTAGVPDEHVQPMPLSSDALCLLPASIRTKTAFRGLSDIEVIQRPERDPQAAFLQLELCVPRLNAIHERLWLAGRPMPPRPLSYQVAAGRAIVVSQDIHLHLVWIPGRIFVKPLPRYLLSLAFWRDHLVCDGTCCTCSAASQTGNPVAAVQECGKRLLYKCAHGLLHSYLALVQYESDYHLAVGHHLLPADLSWTAWRRLAWELLEAAPDGMGRVNKRYRYGELREGRLNSIVRVEGLLRGSPADLIRGYRSVSQGYHDKAGELLGPILTAIGYILLVLTAMQVGLATQTLQADLAFQRVSACFTVFAICAPLAAVIMAGVIILVSFVFNWSATMAFGRRSAEFYDSLAPTSPVAASQA